MGTQELAAPPHPLDAFYSVGTIEQWQQVVGDDLHYHFGYFLANEDLETGLRQTVRLFYDVIPAGATVLDVGCGWGGPARLLAAERGCRVEGITISAAQAAYCQSLGLNVRQGDLEQEDLSGHYDVAFLMESLEHIIDKLALLRKLRAHCARLIIATNCMADDLTDVPCVQYADTMHMCTVSQLQELVEAAGWRIQLIRNRRFQSLRTLILFRANLERTFGTTPPPGQLFHLQNMLNYALRSPAIWASNNPLIDIVAD